jgi:hypothetical protein
MRKRKDSLQFVLCIKNEGYPASLEVRKVYQQLPDPLAEARHLVRVIDESGEDYLYSEDYFVPIDLPQQAQVVFARAS